MLPDSVIVTLSSADTSLYHLHLLSSFLKFYLPFTVPWMLTPPFSQHYRIFLQTVRIDTAYIVAWILHFLVFYDFFNIFMRLCCHYFPLMVFFTIIDLIYFSSLLMQSVCIWFLFLSLCTWYLYLHNSYHLNVSSSLRNLHKQPAFQVRGSGTKEY